MSKYATKAQLIELVGDMADKINAGGGGSGGGGGERVRAVESPIDRWLRFDPTNPKGLVIKAGTSIKKSNNAYITFTSDTHIDLTDDITQNGADYFVNLADNGEIHATINKLNTGVTIGRFHTLCAAAGNNLTMKAPASPSSGVVVNDYYLVKSYSETADPDFYDFYNKLITAVEVSTPYDVITCAHPLSGFAAGSILPESVFCLTFHPECLVEDAMVFDKDTGIAVDVYLQSGTGFNTRSKYNQTHTVSRQQMNHQEDYRMVGKKLLRDSEFTSAAIGSNEGTVIKGAADANVVGGHADTSDRRMISAIGCEEMVGYLWQWLDTLCGWTTTSWGTRDGKGTFGNEYGDCYALLAGGAWADASNGVGSRCRIANHVRSNVTANIGGRGSSRVSRYIDKI